MAKRKMNEVSWSSADAIDRYIAAIHACARKHDALLVIGGRQVDASYIQTAEDVKLIPTMSELATVARSLLAPDRPKVQ